MIIRLVIVVALAVVLAIAMRSVSRRKGHIRSGVPLGLTLVTGSGCAECVRAVRALDAAGVEYSVVDAEAAGSIGIRTLSVPIAVVGDAHGSAVIVRRGTAVAADARRLGDAAQSALVG